MQMCNKHCLLSLSFSVLVGNTYLSLRNSNRSPLLSKWDFRLDGLWLTMHCNRLMLFSQLLIVLFDQRAFLQQWSIVV